MDAGMVKRIYRVQVQVQAQVFSFTTHRYNYTNIGGVLLRIFNSDTFQSTTNRDTLEKQN